MKILLAHNYYQQPGGEDRSFSEEVKLLESYGHEVVRYTLHNEQVETIPDLKLAQVTLWNQDAYRELRALIRREQPQVAHFNNTFPLISPAAYYAAKAEQIPVVQTLRNYRLSCVNGYFFRDGRVCEDCLGRAVPWPGVLHACYRSSRTASGVVALLLSMHRLARTWTTMVDVYVALTTFAREKFIQAGLPAEKIMLRPNFISQVPAVGDGAGNYALFVGRLSPEKGLNTLIKAWEQLNGELPLNVVGDGPLAPLVSEVANRVPGIKWLGWKSTQEVYELIGGARVLVFPSELYEMHPRVTVEAFAKGTPVIAAKVGAAAEVVEHGRTGLHFRPGDADDLVRQVRWACTHSREMTRMRQRVRAEFEARYTADQGYERLMSIYDAAIQRAGA